MGLLPAIPLLLALQANPTEPVMVAVTESGRAIQAIDASPGDLEFKTPFGVFVCPTDAVERVEDRTLLRNRFLKFLEDDSISRKVLTHEASAAGLLALMAEQADILFAEDLDRPGLFTLLENWGEDLDNLPEKIKRKERVDWLWARIPQAEPVASAFLSGRLQFELSGSRHADPDRLLERSQIRKGFRDPSALVRRATAGALAAQKTFDQNLFTQALKASVEDPLQSVRLEAARACGEVDRRVARQIWTYVLARNRSGPRQEAARNLGRYGGRGALDPLIHVLAAEGRKSPERFEFAGRKIQVSKEIAPFGMRNHNPSQSQIFSIASEEVWRLGTAFKVRTLEEEDVVAVLAALETWAGETTGRSSEDWKKWYLKERANP